MLARHAPELVAGIDRNTQPTPHCSRRDRLSDWIGRDRGDPTSGPSFHYVEYNQGVHGGPQSACRPQQYRLRRGGPGVGMKELGISTLQARAITRRNVIMIDARLRYLIAIDRAGSFKAAAAAAGVTQSAVTKYIAELEAQVGYTLFYRGRRGSTATDLGRNFIERITRLIEDAEDILGSSMGATDPFASALKIGVCPNMLKYQVLEPLQELLEGHPSVRIEIMSSSVAERMLEHLRHGVVDIAVGFEAVFSGRSELGYKSLGQLRSTLFVRRGHPLLGCKRLMTHDLAACNFVTPSDSTPYGAAIQELYESNGIKGHRRMHIVDYFLAVKRIVKLTDAIGIVNRTYANSESFKRDFATLEHSGFFPPEAMCCAFRRHRTLTPPARVFIAAMRKSAKRLE
jgi:DNA-binding transcriptional LysR family regulator